jgi:5-methyltetrahydrofolate--homocysteine methyltransferase
MFSYEVLTEGIMKGDADVVECEINKALNGGTDAQDILEKGLIGGMSVVGKRFGAGELFLPEVLKSAQAMHKGLGIVKPLLSDSKKKVAGRIVIGTVEGDIHDLGKRIVCFLLEGNGFEVIDLGVDIKGEAFCEAIEKHKPDMRKTINLLKEKGLREKVKIIVGGAPVTNQFATSIGADGYAPEAGSAVEWVKKAISKP